MSGGNERCSYVHAECIQIHYCVFSVDLAVSRRTVFSGGGKAGWYSCGLCTTGLFEQTYGYFEVRCILPKGVGMWSAFWMLPQDFSHTVGNGVETGRSTFGGTSRVPGYLLLTAEVGGANGVAGSSWAGDALASNAQPSDFMIDYVRVYQYRQ